MSKSAVESHEESFNKSDRPLPEPPTGRKRLSLGSLVLVGAAAFVVFLLLLPNALYALESGSPEELGPVATASLESAGSWVSAEGTPEPNALSFTRLGARGSFRLTRAQDRKDLWLLFQVPPNTQNEFVPPSHFVGRLRRLSETGLLPSEVLAKITAETGAENAAFLLVDGELPVSQRPALLLALLLALLSVACLSAAIFLWRDVKSPFPES